MKEQEPFEKLLGEEQDTPGTAPEASTSSNPAESTTLESGATAPVTNASVPRGVKARKGAAPGQGAGALQAAQAGDPESLVQLLATSAQPLQRAEPRNPRPHPDPLPLPGTATVAPAAAAPKAEDASPVQDLAAVSEPVPTQASDAPFAAAPDPTQVSARDGSLVAQPALTPESRLESATPAEAKAPPAPPPAASERAGEILRQMRVQFSPELRTATIQLSPPELGRISIRIRVDGGELHALVRAEKRETLDALQRHVPELKATLEQLGIQARQFDLQLGFEQSGAHQSPHGQQPNGSGARTSEHEHGPQMREHERRLAQTLSAHTGGIDTYA